MKHVLLAAFVAVGAGRCATMVNQTTEKIPVRSTPAGAVVTVDCGSAPLYGGITPTVITVPRIATPCSITLAKEGYEEKRVDFQRQLSSAVKMNKVVAAPVGVAVAIVGFLLTRNITALDPDDTVSEAFSAGTAIAAAPADKYDERSGGAYKQVPGEVDVKLEPTTPVPPP